MVARNRKRRHLGEGQASTPCRRSWIQSAWVPDASSGEEWDLLVGDLVPVGLDESLADLETILLVARIVRWSS